MENVFLSSVIKSSIERVYNLITLKVSTRIPSSSFLQLSVSCSAREGFCAETSIGEESSASANNNELSSKTKVLLSFPDDALLIWLSPKVFHFKFVVKFNAWEKFLSPCSIASRFPDDLFWMSSQQKRLSDRIQSGEASNQTLKG